jgi:UDP-glucuronate 4-epimerase
MKILVTGSAGFIGFHLIQELLKRGDEVIGLDNFNDYYDPKLKEDRNAILEKLGGFTLIRGDILDTKTVDEAVQGVDRVVHLAALAGVRYAFDHPDEYISNNITGFFNVMDSVRRNNIDGLIYASSSSVYGGNEKMPFHEDDRVDNPLSLYGANKRENEILALTYHNLYKTKSTGLRFFTVYGTYGRPDMALFLFTDKILKGETLEIFGEGKMQRDWTYIDDTVSGIIAAVDKNYDNEIFNLGRGHQEELMDFVKMIEEACGKEGKKEMLGMQPGDFRASLADIAKAEKMLGYSPKTDISEGIPKFVEWYRGYYGV